MNISMNLLSAKNHSEKLIINLYEDKTVNICDIYNSENIDISIDIMKDAKLTLNINSIANRSTRKNINISLDHKGSNSKSEVNFFGAGLDNSSISIKISSKTENSKNTAINQKIRGLLLSNDASIRGEPTLVVSKKDANVAHALSIGPIDKETLFYLKAKNLTKEEIIKSIIKSYFKDMLDISTKNEKNLIKNKIEEIINGN